MQSLLVGLAGFALMLSTPAIAQDTPTTDPQVTEIHEDEVTITNDRFNDGEPIPVTITEDMPPIRTERETFNFFRFGPSTLLNLGVGGAGVFLSGGQIYNTHPQAAVRISLDTAFNPHDEGTATYISGNLGGNYYINRQDYSPHIFADLGYGYADGPGVESSNGFTLGVGAGASFFRTTDMQMDLSARYQLLMSTNDVGTPGILALVLGLNFG